MNFIATVENYLELRTKIQIIIVYLFIRLNFKLYNLNIDYNLNIKRNTYCFLYFLEFKLH